MWHESRKAEKAVKSLMVDLQKRAERRRNFYLRKTEDPFQRLRLVGTKCEVHADEQQYLNIESTDSLLRWQGQADNKIDRWYSLYESESKYDARLGLDYIPDPPEESDAREPDDGGHYERYRLLVYHAVSKASEEDVLRAIEVEEETAMPPSLASASARADAAKAASKNKAAIGFDYGGREAQEDVDDTAGDRDSVEEERPLVDPILTFDFGALSGDGRRAWEDAAREFGVSDFVKKALADQHDAREAARIKAENIRNAMGRGRRKGDRGSRDAPTEEDMEELRRAPDYAVRRSPTYEPYREEHGTSRSRSPSPQPEAKIEFITEFGKESGDTSDDGTPDADYEDRFRALKSVVPARAPVPPASKLAPKPAPEPVKKLTPQERLKRKMQLMLASQQERDSIKAREKEEAARDQRRLREEELMRRQGLKAEAKSDVPRGVSRSPSRSPRRDSRRFSRSPSRGRRASRSPGRDRRKSRSSSRGRRRSRSRSRHRSSRSSSRRRYSRRSRSRSRDRRSRSRSGGRARDRSASRSRRSQSPTRSRSRSRGRRRGGRSRSRSRSRERS